MESKAENITPPTKLLAKNINNNKNDPPAICLKRYSTLVPPSQMYNCGAIWAGSHSKPLRTCCVNTPGGFQSFTSLQSNPGVMEFVF